MTRMRMCCCFRAWWRPHRISARRGAARRGAAIQKLESHHQHGGGVVRELQHLLLKGLLGPHRLGA